MQDQSLDRHVLTVVTTSGLEQQRKEWRTQSIIKTRGDGIVLPWTMPALTPQGCYSAVLIQPLQPVHKTRALIITF